MNLRRQSSSPVLALPRATWLALLALVTTAATACSADDTAAGAISAPQRASAPARVVSFAPDGKLDGGMTGYAWVAAGPLATVESPSSCNENGCFQRADAGLCTRGSLPALICTGDSWDCNYEANWGVMVGMNPRAPGEAWGPTAPSTVAVSYEGDSGSYRLTAHVVGDPDDKAYCVDGYVSGVAVEAGQLKTECWASGGDALPSFAEVDMVGLLLTSAKVPVAFDYCVTGVTLDAAPETDRVLISGSGKLSGAMEGWAWVATGDATTLTAPSPCDANGCFRDTGGRLCAQGDIPAVSCTGKGTAAHQCDWQSNWGAVIGLNTNAGPSAWGAAATSRVAIDYSGTPDPARLTAHVAGDPSERAYCVRDYESGQEVTADRFRTQCWSESGDRLESFTRVDSFGLMVPSGPAPIHFDTCINAIRAR